MQALMDELSRLNISIHRVTQTKGIMLLSDQDISDMVGIASEHQVELVLAVGPRATYDTSASVHTAEGQRMGYRLRGQDQIVRARRMSPGIELGCIRSWFMMRACFGFLMR